MKRRAMEPHDLDVTRMSAFQSTGEKQSSWRHHWQTETTQGNVWAGEEMAALRESITKQTNCHVRWETATKRQHVSKSPSLPVHSSFAVEKWHLSDQKTPLKKPTQKKATCCLLPWTDFKYSHSSSRWECSQMCFCFLGRITGKQINICNNLSRNTI